MVPSLDRVVDLIDSTEAQIVALQEVDVGCSRTDTVNQAYEIGRRLGMSHFFCCLVQWEEFPHFTEPDGEYGLAFLCHPDLRPHRTHRWELPLERETSEPRGVFQIEIDWQGGPVKILNTHLSVQRRERAMQLRALCEMVEQLNDQEEECVLMGDFNTVGSSRELRTLRRLIPECVSNRSFTPTFPSRFPLFRLDRVFASAHLQCHSCRVLGTPEARLASDHLPVQVEIGR